MTFVAVEFDNKVNNTHVQGFLRIPTGFNPKWHLGFRQYLIDTYKIIDPIQIYPLNVRLTTDEMGKRCRGSYKNMEDDFNLALRSLKYYPMSKENDSIRRQWSKLDPSSPDYRIKDR